jgi:transglutaminase-like putative cysteine protease
MRIKVRHETTYVYSEPLLAAIQLLRLTPRATDQQFVRRWQVTLDADAKLERGEDAYGNTTHHAFIEGPLNTLKIVVEGEIDTLDAAGRVSGAPERVPARYFLRSTEMTEPSGAIRDLAQDALRGEGGDVLASLHSMNARLHRTMRFDVSATTSATQAADAFDAKAGVCQDFAQIFIAAARSLGFPARYVSGYYLRTDRTDQDAGHAWAEVDVPQLGWVAFDPSHGVCATPRHVRVAVGSDCLNAAPIRGSRKGGGLESLTVAVLVAQGRLIVDTHSEIAIERARR